MEILVKQDKEWKKLVQLFLKAKNEEKMNALLHALLTISERESLVDRYRIIRELLLSEKPQREISEDLKVSIAKITAGSNELKRTTDEFKTFLQRSMKKL